MRTAFKKALPKALAVSAVPMLLLGGCVGVEIFLFQRARPPADMETITEFKAWRRKSIRPDAQFIHQGTNYTVAFGPAGGALPSGPAAYVFDSEGNFVDWTADMGDLATAKFRIWLGGGGLISSPQSDKTQNP